MAKKMGRPPKDPGDRLSEIVPVRMTAKERAEFENAAASDGVGLSEWIRSALTKAIESTKKPRS